MRTWAARSGRKRSQAFHRRRFSRPPTTSRPINADALSDKDLDLGIERRAVAAGRGRKRGSSAFVDERKQGSGTVYVLDRDQLGHFQPGGDTQIVQSLAGPVGPLFGIPAYFNNTVYFSGAHDQVKAFSLAEWPPVHWFRFPPATRRSPCSGRCPASRPTAQPMESSGPSIPPASCTPMMRAISAISFIRRERERRLVRQILDAHHRERKSVRGHGSTAWWCSAWQSQTAAASQR